MTASEQDLCFIDTNVWLYALVTSQDARKASIAKTVILGKATAVSHQVINEVCVNLIKKTHMPEADLQELIASFYSRCVVVESSSHVSAQASQLRGRFSFSFWDSLIVSSALDSGASILYSEDMQDGLVVENRLRIVNPFRMS